MCTLYWELIVGVILALPFRALFYEIFHIFLSLSLCLTFLLILLVVVL